MSTRWSGARRGVGRRLRRGRGKGTEEEEEEEEEAGGRERKGGAFVALEGRRHFLSIKRGGALFLYGSEKMLLVGEGKRWEGSGECGDCSVCVRRSKE